MDHKIVCWGDYAIPVPLWANWMAFDKSGEAVFFKSLPIFKGTVWYSGGKYIETECFDVSPPEPGDWTDQLYWIGD